MKHYTSLIPLDLSKKLKEAGMPKIIVPTYADVFDWLMELGVDMEHSTEPLFVVWDKDVGSLAFKGKTWHEAANKAIEKAIELI